MNLQEFIHEYASDIQTQFPHPVATMIKKHKYTSSVGNERVQFLPHPFSREDQAMMIEDRNGTAIYRLIDWQNDASLRLEVVTGSQEDPNQVWKNTLKMFLDHEKLSEQFPQLVWSNGTNFLRGKVSVRCPAFTPDQQHDLTNVLEKKDYACTFVDIEKKPYVKWTARRNVSYHEAYEFVQICQNILSEMVPYSPRPSLFKRIRTIFR